MEVLDAVMPWPVGGDAGGAEIFVRLPFKLPIEPEIMVSIPNIGAKISTGGGPEITFGALDVGIAVAVPTSTFILKWGFFVQLPDLEGCCSALSEDGISVDGRNPRIDFLIELSMTI